MRKFHMILLADSASNPRRVEFQAEGPDHAFQVARTEEDGVHVELWEGGELLARMTKSGADIWKLESSLGATLAACEPLRYLRPHSPAVRQLADAACVVRQTKEVGSMNDRDDGEAPGSLDRAMTSPIERVARALAGHALSRNAEGDLASASAAVDALWPDYSDAALAVLRTLREPSAAMLGVGDAGVWDRMIRAAIEDETISE